MPGVTLVPLRAGGSVDLDVVQRLQHGTVVIRYDPDSGRLISSMKTHCHRPLVALSTDARHRLRHDLLATQPVGLGKGRRRWHQRWYGLIRFIIALCRRAGVTVTTSTSSENRNSPSVAAKLSTVQFTDASKPAGQRYSAVYSYFATCSCVITTAQLDCGRR